jgi:hypothetical protein
MCNIGIVYDISYIFCLFWRLPVRRGRQNRQWQKKTLIFVSMGPHVSRGSPLGPYIFNIWAHLSDPRPAPHPSMSPMNVIEYIHRLHITNEYIITFIGIDE